MTLVTRKADHRSWTRLNQEEVVEAAINKTMDKWADLQVWSTNPIWVEGPMLSCKRWERESISIFISSWETSEIQCQRPLAASWSRNHRIVSNTNCTTQSTAILNCLRFLVSQPILQREEMHWLQSWLRSRIPWRYFRETQILHPIQLVMTSWRLHWGRRPWLKEAVHHQEEVVEVLLLASMVIREEIRQCSSLVQWAKADLLVVHHQDILITEAHLPDILIIVDHHRVLLEAHQWEEVLLLASQDRKARDRLDQSPTICLGTRNDKDHI